jgi:transposase
LAEQDDEITLEIVEIDETVIRRRKYNRGRPKKQWLFGGIDRKDGKVFCVLVPDRKSETVLPIMSTNVKPGSHIISDCLSSYDDIKNGGIYMHSAVNHSQNFVPPHDSGTHTQNIASVWSSLKHTFKRMRGTRDELCNSYIQEFVWRRNVVQAKQTFSCVLVLISEKYQL